MENVVIVGSGPAGLTAAIYTARANLKPLVISGMQPGGQLTTTTEVENYPGFPDGVQGPQMMAMFRKQAERFGARFMDRDVDRVVLNAQEKTITIGKETVTANAVIISTGASAKLLGLEAEKKLMGKGVSTCATCDGFFFRGQAIAVVGGGDTAMEEANFLTRFASKLYLIHRRDQFRASKIMLERVQRNPKITLVLNSVVEQVVGDDEVTGIQVKNLVSGEVSALPVTGLFVAIGHTPNTALFKGQLPMDERGYLKTLGDATRQSATATPGVFVCGDVQDPIYRQAITAAGSGCMAALDCERYLETLHG